MAGRNNNKMTPVQSNVRFDNEQQFTGPMNDIYIDTARALSIVNRKLFSQEREYTIKNITANYPPSPLYDRIVIQVLTAGNTWTVHNSWTKAKALHSQMQDLVLDDMPSVEGKWAEFKIYLDETHSALSAPFTRNPLQAGGAGFNLGEWDYSTFVLPQHSVDGAGNPLPALEVNGHLTGADTATSRGLIKAYAESRATVQAEAPSVPITAEDSFYNLLTDSGSQEPELAGVIIEENDQPPYHPTNYVGTSANGGLGQLLIQKTMSTESPNLNTGSFLAQCGLIHMRIYAYLGADAVASPPQVTLNVEVAKGTYKGLQATPMGQ